MNSRKIELFKKRTVRTMIMLLKEELSNMLDDKLKKKKRLWVRKWISERSISGGSALLLKQIKLEDPSEYRLALRLTADNFDELLSLIESSIQRQDTIMREALPAKIKLEITLTYLATGMSYRSISHFYRVSKSSISQLIPQVCRAIYTGLKQFIKVSIIYLDLILIKHS